MIRMRSTSGGDRAVVVDPVPAVVGLAGVVDGRDADRQRAPVGVQALGQLARRTRPSSGGSPPTCRGRRRRRTARSRCRCRRSRRRRRTRRSRRRGGPAAPGRRGSPPSRRLGAVEDRRHERHARVAGDVEELLGLRRSARSASTSIVSTPVRRVPERRHLVERVGARRRAPAAASSSAQYGAQAWTSSGAGWRRRRRRRRRRSSDGDRWRRTATATSASPPTIAARRRGRRRRRVGRVAGGARRRRRRRRRSAPRSRGVTRPSRRRRRRARPAPASSGDHVRDGRPRRSRRPSPSARRSAESSIATHSVGSTPSAVGGEQVRLGVRLAVARPRRR